MSRRGGFDIERLRAELVKKPAPPPPPPLPVDKGEQIVMAEMLDGRVRYLRRKKIVGCCHNKIHPGKLTKPVLYAHECLEKKCPYFEKYDESPFWAACEKRRRAREEVKRRQKKEKARLQAEEASLGRMRDALQRYADASGAAIDVVRVVRLSRHAYRAFYVSDDPFPDWDSFSCILEAIEKAYPSRSVSLRRIRDEDGRLVTREEFYARKT